VNVASSKTWIEVAKRCAAEKAVKDNVESGAVVGLGSGSTAAYAIRMLGTLLHNGSIKEVLGVPTSLQAATEAIEACVPLTTLDEHPVLDLGIDGVDQLDNSLNSIKGGGGALLREKVIASASKRYIIVADETKLTAHLGKDCSLPIEVLPFALRLVMQKIGELGSVPIVRLGDAKVGPVVTDNGNLIIDAHFGAISEPQRLEKKLKMIPGVIETGLFLDYVDVVYLGSEEGVRLLRR
jgi:ribose 5-phosphate isomerase A